MQGLIHHLTDFLFRKYHSKAYQDLSPLAQRILFGLELKKVLKEFGMVACAIVLLLFLYFPPQSPPSLFALTAGICLFFGIRTVLLIHRYNIGVSEHKENLEEI